jgi:hypothetical protein
MRHTKIDAILELIDGALAAYTLDTARPAAAVTSGHHDARPARSRHATADAA